MLLTVLMPSNRKLGDCRKSIDSAAAYCQQRGAHLIVSDNSGDPDKERILRGHPDLLTYTQPTGGTTGKDNLLHLLSLAESEFIFVMGDDDEIYANPQEPFLDLACLPGDFIGARPLTAVVGSDGKVRRVKTFELKDETPSGRVVHYNESASGDNTTYYSIYRRKPFTDLQRFFYASHPLQADFCDWVLAHTLFASGKLAYDPGTIYKYNMHKWETREQIESNMQTMLETAGLPANMSGYMLLLTYLDLSILGCRRQSPLNDKDKLDLLSDAGMRLFHTFSRHVLTHAHDYSIDIIELALKGLQEGSWKQQFQLGMDMVEFIRPGLKQQYQRFNSEGLGLTVEAA